jgi:hypothetical protein
VNQFSSHSLEPQVYFFNQPGIKVPGGARPVLKFTGVTASGCRATGLNNQIIGLQAKRY